MKDSECLMIEFYDSEEDRYGKVYSYSYQYYSSAFNGRIYPRAFFHVEMHIAYTFPCQLL